MKARHDIELRVAEILGHVGHQVHLEPGDILIGYTDGVTEAMSPDEKCFGKRRFFDLLDKPASSAFQLIKRIKKDLYNHLERSKEITEFNSKVWNEKKAKGLSLKDSLSFPIPESLDQFKKDLKSMHNLE